jgi:hypothetical protein
MVSEGAGMGERSWKEKLRIPEETDSNRTKRIISAGSQNNTEFLWNMALALPVSGQVGFVGLSDVS